MYPQKVKRTFDFKTLPIDTLQISPVGIVPKSDGKSWRMITHLSYPEGRGINDFIDPDLCTVRYVMPNSSKSSGCTLKRRNALLMSMTPSSAFFPSLLIISMTLSKEV
jgi:hypothetical protein